MKPKVYVAAILAVVVTAVAGCAPAKPSSGAQQTQSAAKADFKLGVILPYTQVYAALGESITNGMQLYFDEVKQTAGGRKIVLVKEDEEAGGEIAVRKTRKLIEQDKVDMITGYVSSGSVVAIRDIVHEAKMPTVISNAGADVVTRARKSPYIFRTSFTNWQHNTVQGEWGAKNLGKKAVTIAADYQAGKDKVAAFKETYLKAGGQVVGEVWPPLGNQDFAPFLAKVKEHNPEMVYAFFAGADATRFLKQWQEFGLNGKIPLISDGSMVEEDVLANKEVAEAALGMYSGLGWAYTLESPENKAFTKAYEAKFNKRPDQYAVQGYETARFIVEALNKVDGQTSDAPKLLEAMKGVTFKGPRGEFKLDPETQNIILTIYIRQVAKVGDIITNKVLATVPNWKDPGK